MLCVVCGTPIALKLASEGGMNPWCSDPCGARWRTRNTHLFDVPDAASRRGEQALALLMQRGYLDDDVRSLVTLSQVSTGLRPIAKEHELGGVFTRPAVHVQQKGMKTETYTKDVTRPTGRTITKTMTSVKGLTFKRQVREMETVTETRRRQVPNIVRQPITADQMLEIALMAYNTAIGLKAKGRPVILYRVDSKGQLSADERKTQTLSSSVHACVGPTEVWPLEKTAAWIQGALRARVSFLLLNDPRGADMLIGGVDKRSDAVYVRELHQITSTRYDVALAPEGLRPQKMRGTPMFLLTPPAKELGVLPLVPRLSPEMWSHTWNSSQSSLTLADDAGLIRDHLAGLFTDAGERLGIPAY